MPLPKQNRRHLPPEARNARWAAHDDSRSEPQEAQDPDPLEPQLHESQEPEPQDSESSEPEPQEPESYESQEAQAPNTPLAEASRVSH